MDPAMMMQLLQKYPELAQALTAQMTGQGKQAQGELGAVADMPPEVAQGMSDIYASPDIQKLLGEEKALATGRSDQPKGAGVGPYNAYVAPHWTQNLNAAAAQGREGMLQQKMMADILRKRGGSEKYNDYAQQQARKLMEQQAQQEMVSPHMPPVDPIRQWQEQGAERMMDSSYTGLGDVPPTPARAPSDPQSGPMHDFGPYPPEGDKGQNMSPVRPRGYIPMPWEKAGPARGWPWEG
jgi:hypothetical protein